MFTIKKISLLSVVILFGALLAQGQTLPSGVQKGPTLAGITEYTYPNGLKVLLLPDSGSSTITVNITYLVGSRHEGYGETGMAHLLEHLNRSEEHTSELQSLRHLVCRL